MVSVLFVCQSDLRVWVRHRVLYTMAYLTHLRLLYSEAFELKTSIPVKSGESWLGLDLGACATGEQPACGGTSFNSLCIISGGSGDATCSSLVF